jgi:hypothetical protein
MRNMLQFPDGSVMPFMYPMDREIEVGTLLRCLAVDNSEHVLRVVHIEQQERQIVYHLQY